MAFYAEMTFSQLWEFLWVIYISQQNFSPVYATGSSGPFHIEKKVIKSALMGDTDSTML